MGGPISWLSQRQKSVALSTTEAEFMAASEAAKQIIWLTRLLSEITSMVAVPESKYVTTLFERSTVKED